MPQSTPVSRELAAECLANWAERNRRKGEKPEQTGRDILQETEEAIVSDAHPSPRLPVELITTICEFISGSRALATLASVNTSSNLFRSVTMPILYETVFWDDQTDWMTVFPRDHECWKHIKYTFTLTTSTFDKVARRTRKDDSQIHCPKLRLSCSLKASDDNAMFMRLLHTMKTDSLLKLIRQTPIRHWDNGKVESIRCSTSSSLYLQIGDGATLLPSDVNAKGYYTFPSNTAMSEACVRLPRDDETPTYDFVLELCRILAQSREGYFESDHLCAKSLPMLMMVLENEAQTERFKSAFTQLLLDHTEHVNFHFRLVGPVEYRLRDVYCLVRHLARAYALAHAKRPDHVAFTGRSILAVRLLHKNLQAYLRYSPEAPGVMELEIWQEREEDTLVSEVWEFEALREVEIPAPSELRWIAVEEEIDEEGNPTVIREVEVNSSDVGSGGSDDESEDSESDSDSGEEDEEDQASGSDGSVNSIYQSV
ncbi:hypothetical protein QFC20_000409 [Naganishia adeliensis]|uniref:Uncharacterized protein n=1 Tax=Naganishia adeliensis TaxID=92952 RepID=A0ACC2WZS5_9TREE|nr:hypothetical protein QFC20_000409 [Naganishia adeliensis]